MSVHFVGEGPLWPPVPGEQPEPLLYAEPVLGWRAWRVLPDADEYRRLEGNIQVALAAGMAHVAADLSRPRLYSAGIGAVVWEPRVEATAYCLGAAGRKHRAALGHPFTPTDPVTGVELHAVPDVTVHCPGAEGPRRYIGLTPARHCTCGLWALGSRDAVLRLLSPGTSVFWVAVGIVKLWGRVIECEHGWRAQHAYPERLSLIVPRTLEMVQAADVAARLEADYGVPVLVEPEPTDWPQIRAAQAKQDDDVQGQYRYVLAAEVRRCRRGSQIALGFGAWSFGAFYVGGSWFAFAVGVVTVAVGAVLGVAAWKASRLL